MTSVRRLLPAGMVLPALLAACAPPQPEPRSPTPADVVLRAGERAVPVQRFGAADARIEPVLGAELPFLVGACADHLAGRPEDAAGLRRAGYVPAARDGAFAKNLPGTARAALLLARACVISATASDPAPLAFRAAIAASLANAGYASVGDRPGIVDAEDRQAGHDYWTGPLGTLALRFLDRAAPGGASSEVTIERL